MSFKDIDKKKVFKMLLTLIGIVVLFSILSKLLVGNSKTLSEYASENPDLAYGTSTHVGTEEETLDSNATSSSGAIETTESIILEDSGADGFSPVSSTLVGTSLNGIAMEDERVGYEEGFYYEPLSDNLKRYITGITYPKDDDNLAISYDDLRLVHIFHYDFDGQPTEGELICNEAIAQDYVEIFYELYLNEYQIEKMLLIDSYDGDDLASMEDNNTSCFNYRVVEGTESLSKHALGLAIDINPFYNPYITYPSKNEIKVSPEAAEEYADRDNHFPYKIDENDLCYKLFIAHGFTWGGNWNSSKDYQHFQKVMK